MVSVFVGVGAVVAVGGVSAAGVVAGRPGEDGAAAGGGVAVVVGAREGLAFQRGVEAFADGVVGAGADRAHRPGAPELVAEAGAGPGSVLGSVIGVKDRPVR